MLCGQQTLWEYSHPVFVHFDREKRVRRLYRIGDRLNPFVGTGNREVGL